ncbi:unnamed protein product [Pieris macdunnoughi]|uniref:Uncharacterized protein n=1 Tax=Pieris macdunnoughi TaxID=345717 RepID=A0A821W568_9NEOP|nr:unnamed protein product [Pieris macdunnoughi]
MTTDKPRVASQDGSRCMSPVARHSVTPGSYTDAPIRAASKIPKERESTGDEPSQAAPRTVLSPTEPTASPHREASTVATRLTASVEPKGVTLYDATILSESEGEAPAARSMPKTVATTENA